MRRDEMLPPCWSRGKNKHSWPGSDVPRVKVFTCGEGAGSVLPSIRSHRLAIKAAICPEASPALHHPLVLSNANGINIFIINKSIRFENSMKLLSRNTSFILFSPEDAVRLYISRTKRRMAPGTLGTAVVVRSGGELGAPRSCGKAGPLLGKA